MIKTSPAERNRADPFVLKGGLSLFVGLAANVMGVLANLSVVVKSSDSATGNLAIGAANLIMLVVCGWMWLAKYYLPARRLRKGN